MREKLALFSTNLGAAVSLASALAMQDHVQLVEIIGSFSAGSAPGQASRCWWPRVATGAPRPSELRR